MGRFEDQEAAARGELADLYFSVDMEASGPVPLYHSMYSFGVAAIRGDEIIGTFERNLFTLNPYVVDPETNLFWNEFPKAWEAHRSGILHPPATAMRELGEWVSSIKLVREIPVFLAYPATFDFSWMMAYGMKFAPDYWEFAYAGFDMQSYAACLLNLPFSQARGKNWPERWTNHTKTHTHVALQDAIEQAKDFIEMRNSRQDLQKTLVGCQSVRSDFAGLGMPIEEYPK
jgi:hypothetical protein